METKADRQSIIKTISLVEQICRRFVYTTQTCKYGNFSFVLALFLGLAKILNVLVLLLERSLFVRHFMPARKKKRKANEKSIHSSDDLTAGRQMRKKL